MRDYRTTEQKWAKGIVSNSLGKNLFEVDTDEGKRKRHADQTLQLDNQEEKIDARVELDQATSLDKTENINLEPIRVFLSTPPVGRPVRSTKQIDRF